MSVTNFIPEVRFDIEGTTCSVKHVTQNYTVIDDVPRVNNQQTKFKHYLPGDDISEEPEMVRKLIEYYWTLL